MTSVRTTMELGAAIRAARRKRGWTQAALASTAGISRPTLINLERGNPHGELGVALRVIAALGLVTSLLESPATTSAALDAVLDDLDGTST